MVTGSFNFVAWNWKNSCSNDTQGNKKGNSKFFYNFFMTMLPILIILPITLIIGVYHHELFITDKSNCNYYCGILILNIIIFIIGIFGTALESIKTFKISPLYALLCPIGLFF